MRGFLEAVARRRLAEHEEQLTNTAGAKLPKSPREPHGHDARRFDEVRVAQRERMEQRGIRVRALRAEGWRLAEIAAELGCTEREALYAQTWHRDIERKRAERARRRAARNAG